MKLGEDVAPIVIDAVQRLILSFEEQIPALIDAELRRRKNLECGSTKRKVKHDRREARR